MNIYSREGRTFIDMGNNDKIAVFSNGKLFCEIENEKKLKTIKISYGKRLITVVKLVRSGFVKVLAVNDKTVVETNHMTPRKISKILLDYLEKIVKNQNDEISLETLEKIHEETKKLINKKKNYS